ncbi:MAG TPA: hypothetical protein VF701_02110 [Thermoanaerobaculia bacterium]
MRIRRRRSAATLSISAAEALFVVEAMTLDGRIDQQTLAEYRNRYTEEIRSIESRLARLRELAGHIAPAVAGVAVAVVAPLAARAARQAVSKKRSGAGRAKPEGKQQAGKAAKAKLSPERQEIQRLQGEYLGLMHKIPKTIVKQRFGKKAIEAKGKKAVVAEMKAYIKAKG